MAKKQPLAVLVWKGGQLVPGNSWDRQALAGLAEGDLLEARPYNPASRKQEGYLRVLWRLGAELHRDGAAFTTEGAIKNECKRLAGMFDGYIVRRGQTAEINFRETPDLNAEEIKSLIDVTMNFLVEEVLPEGTDLDALRREAKEQSQKRR